MQWDGRSRVLCGACFPRCIISVFLALQSVLVVNECTSLQCGGYLGLGNDLIFYHAG